MNVPVGQFEVVVALALTGFLAAYLATHAPSPTVQRFAQVLAVGVLVTLTVGVFIVMLVTVVAADASYPPG